MRTPVPAKSRSVLGATELTLLAPLKRGLIPALDSRSYESRATLVLAVLHALGISRREIDPTPALGEAADAIRTIRSFRLAIVGDPGRRQVLLSVSFDGAWEPYMRRIWRDLGALLDLIFCNCEGYLLSWKHAFPAYAAWVRQAQVPTAFYYEDSPLTVADLQDLQQQAGGAHPAPPAANGSPIDQARAAVIGLYRLTDMYPPGVADEDSETLRRAAQLLLGEVRPLVDAQPADFGRTPTERAAWTWFRSEVSAAPLPDDPPLNLANVQGGILEGHPQLAHGCLVLVELDKAAAVVALVDTLQPRPISAAAAPFEQQGPVFTTLAFTLAGLERAGVDAGTLQQLPSEFREGMEARAGLLGDWQHNHPSHWTLPQAYGLPGQTVELSRVHAVVQFLLVGTVSDAWADMDAPAKAPLKAAVDRLHAALAPHGGRVVAVQPMQRYMPQGSKFPTGHFGFADGISQPAIETNRNAPAGSAKVAPGDLLLGHRNTLGDPPLTGRLWNESTFLVVRKLRQHPERPAWQALSDRAKASLVGRDAQGNNLIDGTQGNDFDYAGPKGNKCPLHAHVRRANPRQTRPDLKHVPRLLRRGMSYGPRLDGNNAQDDRGLMFMAYNASIAEQFEVIQAWLAGANSSGPGSRSMLRDPFVGVARAGDPRDFEWTDPNTGQPQVAHLPADQPLVTLQWGLYAFVPSLSALNELRVRAAETVDEDRIAELDEAGQDLPADAPLSLREARQRREDRRTREEARFALRGAALIAGLVQAEQALGVDAALAQWKIALEDMGARMSGTSQAVWAAIRKNHGGVLRTPYGVLVCGKSLVREVFENTQRRYTVSGYNVRLAGSFGQIYLGRDDKGENSDYRRDAVPANAAIMAVTRADAFDSARAHTQDVIEELLNAAAPGQDIAVDVKDLVDGMLARFCTEWFGLPDGTFVVAGGWHWKAYEATCPGHFHAPSRYTFQPQPGDAAAGVGRAHGAMLKEKVLGFVRAKRAQPAAQGRLGQPLFAAFADDDKLATTLIGVMMGFLPTVDGNLRGVLYEWVHDGSLWDHQARLQASATPTLLACAEAALRRPLDQAMQLRPVPELVWRTALEPHTLGGGPSAVAVKPGDTIVVSIVSAMQEDRLAGRTDPYVVFGGDRRVEPHPTHACPGFSMAIGVMLGFLAGLLAGTTLRPTASPMALRLVR